MAIVHERGYRTRLEEESPWFVPLSPYLRRFDALGRFPTPEELSALYAERAEPLGLPRLRFVASVKTRPRRGKAPIELSTLYEGRIVELGEVPTRVADWHDLFNALAFIQFPRAKQALHRRQYELLKARLEPGATRLPNARTREQDALSLFDEGGLLVAAHGALADELSSSLAHSDERPLRTALAGERALTLPFGHALYEHLVAGLPCPLATAFVVALPEPCAADTRDLRLLDTLDVALARALSDPHAFLAPSSARGVALVSLC